MKNAHKGKGRAFWSLGMEKFGAKKELWGLCFLSFHSFYLYIHFLLSFPIFVRNGDWSHRGSGV
jgi:hypothetical protein